MIKLSDSDMQVLMHQSKEDLADLVMISEAAVSLIIKHKQEVLKAFADGGKVNMTITVVKHDR